MRLSGFGKLNIAIGVLGGIGCLLGLIALMGGSSEGAEGSWVALGRFRSFRTYVETYILAASVCSIGFIVGGLGLTTEAKWGRAVSAIAAIVFLGLLVGGNVAGRVLTGRLGGAEGGVEGGRAGAASNFPSIALQLALAAYAVFMLVKLSREAARAK